MTEEEVKGLLKEASEKIKEDFIPSMTNLLMDVFQHGLNKGTEIGVKIGANKIPSSIKWQTGEPKETGEYLITTSDGNVYYDIVYTNSKCKMLFWNFNNVLAWCKLSDIEPYKEEKK